MSIALDRTDGGRALPPPLYHLAGTAVKLKGDHSNPAWRGRVVHEGIAGESLPMVVKLVEDQVTFAVELACGLAARELRLPVPLPGLVVAEREDLPELPDRVKGERLLLVGSHYQKPDALLAEVLKDNDAAEELIWQRVCGTNAGTQGAVWDELVANADRHSENLLFDGSAWWLFDHDLALPPASEFVKQPLIVDARREAAAFTAKANLLAHEMLRRRPNDHGMMELPKKLASASKRLQALAQWACKWQHGDTRIEGLLQLSGVVLGLIELRLPALAEQLQWRIGQPSSDSLWTSPTRQS